MFRLFYIIKKEFLMTVRDLHSLVVLFLMPAAFILIMSLAMQDLFSIHSQKKIRLLLVNHDTGKKAELFVSKLKKDKTFHVFSVNNADKKSLVKQMYRDDYAFGLVLRDYFSKTLAGSQKRQQAPVELLAQPTVSGHVRLYVKNTIAEKYINMRIAAILKGKESMLAYVGLQKGDLLKKVDSFVETSNAYINEKIIIPNSVQQNVPAWLVFSIFFIVIPLSNTFITEKNYGTYARMKSMHVSYTLLMIGKMVPYLVINMLQAVVMFLMGIYIVPLFGGDALQLGSSIAGLICMTVSISIFAISYALCVAAAAKTTEQATVIGGFGNIILGALGGIMVPKFVMPDIMQKITILSPMSWGLEGYHELLLKNNNVLDVASHMLVLITAGVVLFIITRCIINFKI